MIASICDMTSLIPGETRKSTTLPLQNPTGIKTIINESYYRQWFARINQCGWKKQEPEEWAFETSHWLQRNVLRLIAEGILSQIEAERIIGEKLALDMPASVIERRAFLKLPLDKRRRILSDQASSIVQYYKQNSEWKGVEGGDVIEY